MASSDLFPKTRFGVDSSGRGNRRAHRSNGRNDLTADRRQMVVLEPRDRGGIHAVVAAAAASDRVLLELTQPSGGGLACVEDPGAGAGDRLHEGASQSGDTRQLHHSVKRDPLGLQHSAGRARDAQDIVAGLYRRPVTPNSHDAHMQYRKFNRGRT